MMSLLGSIKGILRRRKKSQNDGWEKLLERTNICHSVMENIGAGVSVIGKDMRILAANTKMHQWFPWVEFSKKPVCYSSYNVPPRNEICSYCPIRKTFADGLVHEAVTDTPTPNGVVNYRILSSPIKNDAGEVIAAIEMVEDVTSRFALEKIQKLFSAIVQSADDAIISKDLDGKILSWNNAAEKMYGYSMNEMLGKNIMSIMPHGHAEDFKLILEKIRFGETVIRFETERMRKDGSMVQILLTVSPLRDSVGKIYGATSIAHDISKQKELERSLRAKIDDLERLHKLTIDREKRIIELKERIKELEGEG